MSILHCGKFFNAVQYPFDATSNGTTLKTAEIIDTKGFYSINPLCLQLKKINSVNRKFIRNEETAAGFSMTARKFTGRK
ncbi:hypothetical protein [Lacibacter sp. H407]|uniref:hypothetical protein n=1 Tax=Lacibacter sp. H407 TaxID=3133423 RepID=UPI0030C09FEC